MKEYSDVKMLFLRLYQKRFGLKYFDWIIRGFEKSSLSYLDDQNPYYLLHLQIILYSHFSQKVPGSALKSRFLILSIKVFAISLESSRSV